MSVWTWKTWGNPWSNVLWGTLRSSNVNVSGTCRTKTESSDLNHFQGSDEDIQTKFCTFQLGCSNQVVTSSSNDLNFHRCNKNSRLTRWCSSVANVSFAPGLFSKNSDYITQYNILKLGKAYIYKSYIPIHVNICAKCLWTSPTSSDLWILNIKCGRINFWTSHHHKDVRIRVTISAPWGDIKWKHLKYHQTLPWTWGCNIWAQSGSCNASCKLLNSITFVPEKHEKLGVLGSPKMITS